MAKNSSKSIKRLKIPGIILVVLGVLAAVFFLFFNPYRGSVDNCKNTLALDECLTYEQACEDYDYAIDVLRKHHPAWLEKTEAMGEVERVFEEERAKLYDGMTVFEEYQGLCRVFHVLYDGHTNVFSYGYDSYLSDFGGFRDDNVLVAINGEPLEDIKERFKNIYQYDAEIFADEIFDQNVVVYEEWLRLSGVDTSNGVDYTFETSEGTKDFHYTFVPLEEVKGNGTPDTRGWVYHEIDTENSIGIFTLKSCDYNGEYKKAVKAFFEDVKANNIEHVIVDLRNNGGGSSMVANEFIKYLTVESFRDWDSLYRLGPILLKQKSRDIKNHHKKPQFEGDVYLLTNVRSYSSAMDFAMIFADNHMGTIVGEPCGNLPSSYGQIARFQMPNSHLVIGVSLKRWHRIDRSKDSELIEPDYECPSHDALDKAYELILGE